MELFKLIALIIFLIILGLLMLIYPNMVWKIEHFFTVKNGEPTDWYLAITRLIGFSCVVVSILLIVVFLVLRVPI